MIWGINMKLGKIQRKLKKVVSIGCSQISQTSNIPDYIFFESLNSPDWVAVLFNCLKNLESKMMETLVPSKKITARQIKDEKQLSGLTDSVQLISDKFHGRKRAGRLNFIYKLTTRPIFQVKLFCNAWRKRK